DADEMRGSVQSIGSHLYSTIGTFGVTVWLISSRPGAVAVAQSTANVQPPQQCSTGVCCGDEALSPCGAAWVQLRLDGSNCGGCGKVCPMNTPYCQNSECGCLPSEVLCNGVCVDLLRDSHHCGGCGNVCPQGNICKSGGCAPLCYPYEAVCSGACADLRYD